MVNGQRTERVKCIPSKLFIKLFLTLVGNNCGVSYEESGTGVELMKEKDNRVDFGPYGFPRDFHRSPSKVLF